MKKNDPRYIIRYYFNRLCKYSVQVRRDYNKNIIHLFRVDVKKLRAFLRMLRGGIKEPELLKFSHKFKKMYSLTGNIRDRQLCLKRIKEFDGTKNKKLENRISGLEEEIKQLKEKKDSFLSKKEFSEIEKKIIEITPVEIQDGLLKNFISQKLEAIREIIAKGQFKDKELHAIRKSIKDMVYINRIYRDNIQSPLPFLFWGNDELKNAEDISHLLGLFNDACIALSFVKPADYKKYHGKEKQSLVLLRRKWLGEKRELKGEIKNSLLIIKWNF
ncbi:MAG TPA: CHAD domain-containing protein [Chitinophagaceae bacterium]|nr:CHAD domain-containing protein [Chitinophagaceae bacterium]